MSKTKQRNSRMSYLNTKMSSVRSRLKNLFSEFGDKQPRVLVLGLDGAGKTALLYKAKLNPTIFASVPPHGLNIETMTPRFGATITVWDMKGSKFSRHHWAKYYRHTDGIVYVVDSSDIVRLDEAQFELDDMLGSLDLAGVPVVVAATKQDVDGAMAVTEVSQGLGLERLQGRDWRIHAVSGTSGLGVPAVFRDIVALVKAARQHSKAQRKALINGTGTQEGEKNGRPPSNAGTSECSDTPSLFRNIHNNNNNNRDSSDDASGVSSDERYDVESCSNAGSVVVDGSNAGDDDNYHPSNETISNGIEATPDNELSETLGATLPDPDGDMVLPDAAFHISETDQGPMSDINVFQPIGTQSKV